MVVYRLTPQTEEKVYVNIRIFGTYINIYILRNNIYIHVVSLVLKELSRPIFLLIKSAKV